MLLLLNAFIIISIISINIFGIYFTVLSEQTFLIFIKISTVRIDASDFYYNQYRLNKHIWHLFC